MTYRKDIQILRGIAVLLVILYHLGLAGFKSGFLGVDVFFVISGYLMAVLYDKNNKLYFFKRRAIRLLPAYFIAILSTLIVSIIIVTPNEFNQVFNQSIYAGIFTSNFGYWMQNSYFSKAEFNPLLHLWSLVVEIQYYLSIPFLFYLLKKNKLYFWLFFTASLLLCFVVVKVSPKTSFFMFPFRVWEFLIGYGVAKYLTNNGSIKTSILSWQKLGSVFLLVIFAIPLFKVDGESLNFITGHPGIYALIITVSTGVILCMGINKSIENSIAGNLLELLGKYSYSIYLVHFPIIVLFLYQPFTGTNLQIKNGCDLAILITIITIMSFVMYHLAEVKLRTYKRIKTLMYAAPLVIIAIAFLGINIQKQIYTKEEMLIFNAFADRSVYRCGKIFRILNPTSIACKITKNSSDNRHNIMLVGNSYADSIKTAFANTAEKMNTSVRFLVPNNPLMQGSNITPASLITEAKKQNINSIILHYSQNKVNFETIKNLVTMANKNNIFIAFIMPTPTWEKHIPQALWENRKNGKPLPIQTRKNYDNKTKKLKEALLKIKEKNFKIYNVINYFCNQKCSVTDNFGKPLYFDSGHLTLTGSDKLLSLFKYIINDSKIFSEKNNGKNKNE